MTTHAIALMACAVPQRFRPIFIVTEASGTYRRLVAGMRPERDLRRVRPVHPGCSLLVDPPLRLVLCHEAGNVIAPTVRPLHANVPPRCAGETSCLKTNVRVPV